MQQLTWFAVFDSGVTGIERSVTMDAASVHRMPVASKGTAGRSFQGLANWVALVSTLLFLLLQVSSSQGALAANVFGDGSGFDVVAQHVSVETLRGRSEVMNVDFGYFLGSFLLCPAESGSMALSLGPILISVSP